MRLNIADRRLLGVGLGLLIASGLMAKEPNEDRFAVIDIDDDQTLTLEEFLKFPGEAAVLTRDFRLFDGNGDKVLSFEEFDAIPLGRPANQRGNIPDPFAELLDRSLAQLDERFDQWDENPERQISINEFLQSYMQSFPDPNSVGKQVARLMQDADENQDQQVDRAEATRFLEIQFGIRDREGKLLRLPNGRIIRRGAFLSLDVNQDRVIDRDEFRAAKIPEGKLESQWKLLDTDHNDQITFNEFSLSESFGIEDPIERFRTLDTNLDAFLEATELRAGTPPELQYLVKHVIPRFDFDGNRKLSLWEFRQLPQTNPVLPWTEQINDADRDGFLTFREFTFRDAEFPLLRLIYFSRLDSDSSESLDLTELSYTAQPAQGLFRLNADGTGWRQIFASEEFPVIGSPKISPDGKWLACDAIARGKDFGGTRLLLMTVDGQDAKDFGEGSMPNWSADSEKLTYSGNGAIHELDLETRTTRQLVERGWGAQWSPDGKKIAFTVSGALKTLTVETGQIADVLSSAETPYRRIYWNMAWSPDGQRMVFRGARPNGTAELASVRMEGEPNLKVHYAGQRDFSNNLSWSPDGKRMVFGMCPENSTRTLLHELNPDREGDPVLVKGPDPLVQVDDPCWHPDGTYMIMQARRGDEWTE